ncbi:MAG: alpha-glucan family phosphorylase [SAR202 cluster bacterium]|nr:alpha-glucan family phosphorylase [SAR202 cluster bacterium]
MEVGLEPAMPTYSGGLGVLAGDTLRTAADLGVPMVGVSLLYRQGYFAQHIDESGRQIEKPEKWSPEQFLRPMRPRVQMEIEGRTVHLTAWRYLIVGARGHSVPVYFLDADLPENSEFDRSLAGQLYGGDQRYRVCQEALLGIGGLRMLEALRHDNIRVFHLNEGHAAFLTIGVLEQETHGKGIHLATDLDIEAVRDRCVFTTHTPVPAGHDQFPIDLVRSVLGDGRVSAPAIAATIMDGRINMTYLGIHFSRRVNGVAMRHAQVTRTMFPHTAINAITNGVHAVTWAAEPMRRLFDHHIPEWRRDNHYLRYASSIPKTEIRQAHQESKLALVDMVRQRTGRVLDPDVFTIGFARRATAYKRMRLLFSDLNRLRRISGDVGPIQIVLGGKAHPRDEQGKHLIQMVVNASRDLSESVRVVFVEGYDMGTAAMMCAGVDLWVNTPQKPMEASGTSGMKAAINGVPSLSVMDGWWIEGYVEGVTGWAIDEHWKAATTDEGEAASLYDKLERVIVPMFYRNPDAYASAMRSAIAINGSFFNSQRMVQQYVENAYPVLS